MVFMDDVMMTSQPGNQRVLNLPSSQEVCVRSCARGWFCRHASSKLVPSSQEVCVCWRVVPSSCEPGSHEGSKHSSADVLFVCPVYVESRTWKLVSTWLP